MTPQVRKAQIKICNDLKVRYKKLKLIFLRNWKKIMKFELFVEYRVEYSFALLLQLKVKQKTKQRRHKCKAKVKIRKCTNVLLTI